MLDGFSLLKSSLCLLAQFWRMSSSYFVPCSVRVSWASSRSSLPSGNYKPLRALWMTFSISWHDFSLCPRDALLMILLPEPKLTRILSSSSSSAPIQCAITSTLISPLASLRVTLMSVSAPSNAVGSLAATFAILSRISSLRSELSFPCYSARPHTSV